MAVHAPLSACSLSACIPCAPCALMPSLHIAHGAIVMQGLQGAQDAQERPATDAGRKNKAPVRGLGCRVSAPLLGVAHGPVAGEAPSVEEVGVNGESLASTSLKACGAFKRVVSCVGAFDSESLKGCAHCLVRGRTSTVRAIPLPAQREYQVFRRHDCKPASVEFAPCDTRSAVVEESAEQRIPRNLCRNRTVSATGFECFPVKDDNLLPSCLFDGQSEDVGDQRQHLFAQGRGGRIDGEPCPVVCSSSASPTMLLNSATASERVSRPTAGSLLVRAERMARAASALWIVILFCPHMVPLLAALSGQKFD